MPLCCWFTCWWAELSRLHLSLTINSAVQCIRRPKIRSNRCIVYDRFVYAAFRVEKPAKIAAVRCSQSPYLIVDGSSAVAVMAAADFGAEAAAQAAADFGGSESLQKQNNMLTATRRVRVHRNGIGNSKGLAQRFSVNTVSANWVDTV